MILLAMMCWSAAGMIMGQVYYYRAKATSSDWTAAVMSALPFFVAGLLLLFHAALFTLLAWVSIAIRDIAQNSFYWRR